MEEKKSKIVDGAYRKSGEEVIKELSANPENGLSEKEVKKRKKEYGAK